MELVIFILKYMFTPKPKYIVQFRVDTYQPLNIKLKITGYV